MKKISEFLSENRKSLLLAVVFSIAMILAGSYFGRLVPYMVDPRPGIVFEGAEIKVGFLGNVPKLFVLSERMPYRAKEGKARPQGPGEIVLGFSEAEMMREEKLFSSIGDGIEGFFGLDVRIAGILERTGTIIDDAHLFSSAEDFGRISAGKYDSFHAKTPMGEVKFFLQVPEEEALPEIATASEGEFPPYFGKDGQYEPIIIGSAEAEMMRKEGLFSNVGDTIDGFFGKDVRIVAVLARTNSSLDMMHIVRFRI